MKYLIKYLIALVLSLGFTLSIMSLKTSTAHSPIAEKVFFCIIMGAWSLAITGLISALQKRDYDPGNERYWEAVMMTDRIRARGRHANLNRASRRK